MSFIGEAIAGIRLAIALMNASAGRTVVAARPSPTCDLRLTNRDMGTFRQWSARVAVGPKRLELRNAEGYQFHLEGKLRRVGYGELTSNTTAVTAGKYCRPSLPVEIYFQPVQVEWIADIGDATSAWEVEVSAVLGPKSARLYRGRPTSVVIDHQGLVL